MSGIGRILPKERPRGVAIGLQPEPAEPMKRPNVYFMTGVPVDGPIRVV